MTSQKRYRHHQENNAQRFRDLPPRFKRQKSITSQNDSASTTGPTCNSTLPTPSTSPVSQIGPSTSPTLDAMTRRSNPGNAYSGHACSRPSSSNSNQQTHWEVREHVSPKPVLCQVEDRNLKSPPSIHHKVPANYSGIQAPIPAWPAASQVPPNHTAFMSNPWAPISVDMYTDQRLPSPVYYMCNRENCAPIVQPGPVSPWNQPMYSPYHSATPSPSPPLQNPVSTANLPQAMSSPSGGQKEQSSPDLSDPDIRTIEMLKELERVADQKESEAEDFGSDRKTLVSHHLRMLMCAVDRYTEGIDEDVKESSRMDEVPSSNPAHSTSVSPTPTKPTQEFRNKQKTISRETTPASATWTSQSSKRASVSPRPASIPAREPTPVTSVWSSTPAAPKPLPQSLMPTVSKASPAEVLSPVTPRTPEWNLWSSPGFDFFSGGNPASSYQNVYPVEQYWNSHGSNGTPGKRERKALYNR